MKRILFALTGILSLVCSAGADKIISDAALGYSIYLPGDSWTRVIRNANHHQFYDTTFVFKSQVSIVRHPYSSADFPSPESWTRANFIAYKLSIDYSFDPWAAMLYYDTTATVRQGTGWATESYSFFYMLDTLYGAWSEYTRFTARSGYGWELYAIGDTTDMMENIGTYAAILTMVQLPTDSSVRVAERLRQIIPTMTSANGIVPRCIDPLGRVIRTDHAYSRLPAGFFIIPQQKKPGIVVR